jgi:hypothetical protein
MGAAPSTSQKVEHDYATILLLDMTHGKYCRLDDANVLQDLAKEDLYLEV